MTVNYDDYKDIDLKEFFKKHKPDYIPKIEYKITREPISNYCPCRFACLRREDDN